MVWLTLSCTATVCGAAGKAGHTEIRVLSYNVHHCNPPSKPDSIDIQAVANVINEAAPDLVALQEIDVRTERSGPYDQAAELARLTGMYAFFAKTIDFQGGEYGVAVLSKYPFVGTLSFMLPSAEGVGGEPRGVAAVLVEPVPGKRISFASTHLDLRKENRKEQIDALISYASDMDMPFILAGDFNDQPGSYVIRKLDETFRRTCTDDCAHTIPVLNPRRTIDFIAFKPEATFDVTEHRVIAETYASDHLPVLAVLRIR